MANSEDRPPPAVGAYWIDEEDYPALLKIFADGKATLEVENLDAVADRGYFSSQKRLNVRT
jgi:hypothetical protein